MQDYLEPTPILDFDHQAVGEAAIQATARSGNDIEKAKSLFYFVRDRIRYTVHVPRFQPEDFKASATLARGEGFCIQKAVLLAALSRAVGIPSRLGFAVIRNHLLPEKIAEILKNNEIPDHGYADLYLADRWVKATPAFDLETCHENRFIPVEFDGASDARFNRRNLDGNLHIEYITYRGTYADLPFDDITAWVTAAV
ncbi:MAG: transglutaminase domain-containing protein, partial [Deltaproteobacteria bacterium]|nr:transglutaminase domain-containing protein [Deltaproteobacteria bacterium]